MKNRSGLLIVSGLRHSQWRPVIPIYEWYKRLSTLRVAAEVQKTGPFSDELIAKELFWDDRSAEASPPKLYHLNHGTRSVTEGPPEFGGWNKLCEKGHLDDAFRLLDRMCQQGTTVTTSMLYRLLKGCIAKRDWAVGRNVHALAVRSGYEFNPFLANHIIRMYASHGNLAEAIRVFNRLPSPDVYTWTSIITAHVEHGHGGRAIELYQQLRQSDVEPDDYIFVAALKACGRAADRDAGKLVHADVVTCGFESNAYVCSSLVDMYSKCGDLMAARSVFDKLESRDLVTWSALMSGYALHGFGLEALQLYKSMQQQNIIPDSVTFISLLKACSRIGALQEGIQIHNHIRERGLETDLFVGNTLVDMYSNCGNLEEARKVFDCMPTRNIATWNVIISGHVQNGSGQEALSLYVRMQEEGMTPNHVTFISILKACGSLGALKEGKQVHSQVLEMRSEAVLTVACSLVDMYVKCGSLPDAHQVFDRLVDKDVAIWTAMIAGYGQQGHGQEALDLYARMEEAGVRPNNVTYVCIVKACGILGAIQEGERIHGQIIARGLQADPSIANSLIGMYMKFGNLEAARRVFDKVTAKTVVTWNAMIAGYTSHGLEDEAMNLFASMQEDGIVPNSATFIAVLKACASLTAIHEGRSIHSSILEAGLDGDLQVCNALLDMYVKCANMEDARALFDKLQTRDVVTWNTMLSGYVSNELERRAFDLYATMQEDGFIPNGVTFILVLKACGNTGAIKEGRRIHSQIVERGLESDCRVECCLMDMYGKCGSLDDAQGIFDRKPERDVVTWTALINAYGQHNDCHKAIQCFDRMLLQGVTPNAATYTSLLTACSHFGLVSKGKGYFQMMLEDHGISPGVEHYTCMVDLLGRSGHLSEAEDLIRLMPFKPDLVCWMSLLTACKIHGNVELGRRCFDEVTRLDPQQAAGYVLMSSIYSDAQRWEGVQIVEHLMTRAGAKKKPAMASIEVNNKVHEFIVGGERVDTSSKLQSLNQQIEDGAIPDVESLHGLSDRKKEDELCGHAEKLALAFGLLNTPQGSPLVVVKNLRMCDHCHSGTKIISRLESREVIIRDAHRVHHFKNGLCSCGDRH